MNFDNQTFLIGAKTVNSTIQAFVNGIMRSNSFSKSDTAVVFDIEFLRYESCTLDKDIYIEEVKNGMLRFILFAPSNYVYVFSKSIFGLDERVRLLHPSLVSKGVEYELLAHHDSGWKEMVEEALDKVANGVDNRMYQRMINGVTPHRSNYRCSDIVQVYSLSYVHNFSMELIDSSTKRTSLYKLVTGKNSDTGEYEARLIQQIQK